jgi:MoxR-like ATPase
MNQDPTQGRRAPDSIPERLVESVERAIRGKDRVVRQAIIALIARGHLLIEDVPGVGKTTLARALARSVGGDFHRIQFTSDLLPSDIIGVNVWDPQVGAFDFRRGPVFANVVLADEINRTTPRTQSALLEAMSEGTVSVDNTIHQLPEPFFVIATQNPVEHYGTYPLPDSQLDRFLMRIRMGYPSPEAEREIVTNGVRREMEDMEAVIGLEELRRLQDGIEEVRVDPDLTTWLVDLVSRTREWDVLEVGVSPRGSQDLYRACQTCAVLEGRDHVIPDDVKAMASPVLAHRLIPRDPSLEGLRLEALLEALLEKIPVPV